MSGPIRVILADDHDLVVEGLRLLLDAESDMQVVGTAKNGADLMELLGRKSADVVVLDLEMGGIKGLDCLERVRTAGIPVRVLILTAYNDGGSMRAALEAGADGYALKTEPPQNTIASIRQVVRGQLVFPAAAKRWLLGGTAPLESGQLTAREREVLSLLAEGLTNAQLAARMRVSGNTVKFHLQNLYLKLGVANRTEAVALFLRDGNRPQN